MSRLAKASSVSNADAAFRRRLLAILPVTERHVRCAGIPTAVLEGGDGRPLVLLHGPFGYAAHWLRVIPALTASYRVIAPDLPGHGSSELSDGRLDVERGLSWLDELIEQCAGSPPLIVGNTLGGAIAARFAGERRRAVRALVLVDTLGLAEFQPQREFGDALGAFIADPTQQTHEGLWRQCAYDLDVVRKALGAYWEPLEAYNLDRARTPSVASAAQALLQAFGTPIPQSVLAAIAAPTTLIWGRHDRATSLQVAHAASQRYGWPLVVIEDAADEPAMDQPESFLRALQALAEATP